MDSLEPSESLRFIYGIVPSLGGALTLAGEERRLWSLVGDKGLSSLTAPLFGG
jgi:hypothetical protein